MNLLELLLKERELLFKLILLLEVSSIENKQILLLILKNRIYTIDMKSSLIIGRDNN